MTSFISLALNKPIRPRIALSGEISLTGKVLPVGGIKEKVMAAKRNNIQEIILPEQNKKDVDELPSALTQDIKFHFAKEYRDVFQIVFP